MNEKTNIYLYANIPLSREKNRVIEDIASYLSTPFITRTYNYFKNEFETQITLENVSRSSYDMASVTIDNVNYLKAVPIYNETEKQPLYYFVERKDWTSESSVKLTLRMDVLNTFEGQYVLTDKTHISRKHQDRFSITQETITIQNDPNYMYDADGDCTFTISRLDSITSVVSITVYEVYDGTARSEINNDGTATIFLEGYTDWSSQYVNCKIVIAFAKAYIDRYSEGLTPTLYKTSERNLNEFDALSSGYPKPKWNVVYKNLQNIDPSTPQIVNPVECLLYPDEPAPIIYNTGNIVYTDLPDQSTSVYAVSAENNDLDMGQPMYCFCNNGDDTTIVAINKTSSSWLWFESIDRWLYFWASGTKIKVVSVWQGNAGGAAFVKTHKVLGEFDNIAFSNNTVYAAELAKGNDPENLYNSQNAPTSYDHTFTVTQARDVLDSVESIDRTDSKLIKIIRPPYCPVSMKTGLYNNQRYYYEPEFWQYAESYKALLLNKQNYKFTREFTVCDDDGHIISNPGSVVKNFPSGITGTESRQLTNGIDKYETKLYHSDFYQPKFVYDSFSFLFRLENVDVNTWTEALKIEFSMTSTINSKFLFRFPGYKNNLLFDNEDYSATLPVARNNEAVLFNSQYINYIRTGYNYDVKNLKRQNIASMLGIAGNMAGLGVSLGTGNVLGGFMTVSAMVNSLAHMTANEQSLQQQLHNAEMQSVNVSGSDDIDLLEIYSGNIPKLCIYEVSPRVKKSLSDLFYYFGYIDDEYTTPNLKTRYWFDFIQCTAVINPVKNMSKAMVDSLVESYANGVTIFHNNNNTWNLEQDKENWERTLFST